VYREMFEHLKNQAGLSWRHRLTYLLASATIVLGIFLSSLWFITRTVQYFDLEMPFFPVRVHYDADEDGQILNEVLPEIEFLNPKQAESETVSPPP
jgi:hypothetical protein